jgi:hypothetical protein
MIIEDTCPDAKQVQDEGISDIAEAGFILEIRITV